MLTSEELNARLPYTFSGEIEALKNLAQSLPDNARVLMLGAGPGIMSLALLEANPQLNLVAVEYAPSVMVTYRQHLKAAGMTPHVLLGKTADCAKDFPDDSHELIVVDASHTYESVKEDATLYWPKLKVGGIMWFHDYIDLEKNGTNGVRQAVEELRNNEWQYMDEPGVSIVFRKVKVG